MNSLGGDNSRVGRLSVRSEVRVAVENLGPIRKGDIDLRPLTVFVGPSNTGKTYFAMSIYAMHRVFSGFPRFPFMSDYLYSMDGDWLIPDEEYRVVVRKLRNDQRPFHFSDMPEVVRAAARDALDDPGFLAAHLGNELERCFDVERANSLIRTSSRPISAKLSLRVGNDERKGWSFRMAVSDSDIDSTGHIDDVILLRDKMSDFDPSYAMRFGPIRNILLARGLRRGDRSAGDFVDFLETLVLSMPEAQSRVHYFPADRSGVMHSHRVIASSLIKRSTRGGLERFPELPTLPGVMADFIEQLVLHDEPAPGRRPRRRYGLRREPAEYMDDIADILERETLGGQIQTVRRAVGGYPEFVYCPEGTKRQIRLSRASSMVSELASLVLLMRSAVGRGDTVIIEEPEAHLHPAAQTEMAKALTRLVRGGVRVIVTTHSDWLLQEIGNAMREGELAERAGETPPAHALRPGDVGVWLFANAGAGGGSSVREIPFDRVEGVEPPDYEDVADRLYNRSADLQNRFEEGTALQSRRS